MQHQQDCPFSAVSVFPETGGVIEVEGAENSLLVPDHPCPDRRCCVWLDLSTWFGFHRSSLSELDFTSCFADIGHGGTGVYEKLAVLGRKSLEMVASLYVSEKYNDYVIPFDIKRMVPRDVLRKLWTHKRVERICSTQALYRFGTAYLSTAQSMPTPNCIAKLVRAMFGFAVQTHAMSKSPLLEGKKQEIAAAQADKQVFRETGIIYEWATILIDNIYWIQKFKGEGPDYENELIQDLQEYFGYPYDTLIPRLTNILDHNLEAYSELDFSNQAENGKELLQLVATNYFVSLAEHSGLPMLELDRWLDAELKIFMNSAAIQIFVVTYMNLLPYLQRQRQYALNLPGAEVYQSVFLQLMLGCYIVTQDDRSRTWLGALMQRLRHIQVVLHMEEIDTRMYGPIKSPLALFQGIDIFRWSTIAQWHREWRTGNWLSAKRETVPEILPVSDLYDRRRIRKKEKAIETEPDSLAKQAAKTVCGLLKTVCCPDDAVERNLRIIEGLALDTEDMRAPCNRAKEPCQVSPVIGPDVRDPCYYSHWRTNKKPLRQPKGTIFTKLSSRFRAARELAAQRLREQEGGNFWRPPGAWFMQPRVVDFQQGEAFVSPWLRRPACKTSKNGDVCLEWGPREAQCSTSDSSTSTDSTSDASEDSAPHACETLKSLLKQGQKEDKLLFSDKLNQDNILELREKADKSVASAHMYQKCPNGGNKWSGNLDDIPGYNKVLGVHMLRDQTAPRMLIEHQPGLKLQPDTYDKELAYSIC